MQGFDVRSLETESIGALVAPFLVMASQTMPQFLFFLAGVCIVHFVVRRFVCNSVCRHTYCRCPNDPTPKFAATCVFLDTVQEYSLIFCPIRVPGNAELRCASLLEVVCSLFWCRKGDC